MVLLSVVPTDIKQSRQIFNLILTESKIIKNLATSFAYSLELLLSFAIFLHLLTHTAQCLTARGNPTANKTSSGIRAWTIADLCYVKIACVKHAMSVLTMHIVHAYWTPTFVSSSAKTQHQILLCRLLNVCNSF